MIVQWLACSFCYYLINFLIKYLPGDIFTNGYTTSAAEVASYVASGFLLKFLNVKISFLVSHVIGFAGMFCMLMLKPDDS